MAELASLLDAAGLRLAYAEEPDGIAAVGVEAELAVGERAGIGGEEGLTVGHAHSLDLPVALPTSPPSSRMKRISSPRRFWNERRAEIAAGP